PDLLDADSGTKSSDYPQVVTPSPSLGQIVLEGRPQLGRRRQGAGESFRHHPRNQIGAVTQRDGATDDRGVSTEAPSPESVAQDHHPGPIGSIFDLVEVTAKDGLHAQHLEVARGDALAVDHLRLGSSVQSRLPLFGRGHALEGAAPFYQLPIGAEGAV